MPASSSFQFADNPRPVMIRSLLRRAADLTGEVAAERRAAGAPAAMVQAARQAIDLCILAVLVQEHKPVPDDCLAEGRLPPLMYVDGLDAYKNLLGLDHGPSRVLVDRREDHPGWQISDGDAAVATAAEVVRVFIQRYAPGMVLKLEIAEPSPVAEEDLTRLLRPE